jgi:hypothetical protein
MQIAGTRLAKGAGKLTFSIGMTVILLTSHTVRSYAHVKITAPASNATVNGTVIIKANVTHDYASQLLVDGAMVANAGKGKVSFTWNSALVSNGSHSIEILGFPKQRPANSSANITVNVQNQQSSSTPTHFGTLPASSTLPTESSCAQMIGFETEMIPDNQTPNNTTPTGAQLSAYAANGYTANYYDGEWAYARVDGQYSGTTDMIMRWAACKWGVDEDVVRAQATVEVWSWDQTTAEGDLRTSYSSCVNGNFTSLWDFQCAGCCYQSWSIWQTKVYYAWQTWPMMYTSTPFAADFRYADQRACMNGDLAPYFNGRPAYNGHTYAGDISAGDLDTILWGCIGFHYSGNWFDGDSNSGAMGYMAAVQNAFAQKSWKTRWPAVNWPD